GGYLAMSGRRADGGPALPGATVADSAAGGVDAAIAILAALARGGARRGDGRGRVPRRVGGRRGAVAHVAAHRPAPGDRRAARAWRRPPLRSLRLPLQLQRP